MSFLNILLSIVLGAAGWITLEFIGRPVRRFFDLRAEANTALIQYNDPSDKDQKAKAALSEIGVKLTAFDAAEPAAAWLVRYLGYSPKEAGYAFSNLSEYWGVPYTAYDSYRYTIRETLKIRRRPSISKENPF